MMFDGLTDVEHLPEYVRKQPSEMRQRWIAIYETVFASTGDTTRALLAANVWLRSRVMKQLAEESLAQNPPESPTKELVAARSSRRILKFSVDTTKEFIKRSDSGEEYIVAMLQDVYGDSDGMRWSAELLQKFADQINSGKVIVGDVDHEEWDRVLDTATTDGEITARLSEKRGIAKSVQASFEDGKLWVKALIDKRYKKLLKEQAKGLSLEAVVTRNDNGSVVDGEILGFTFIVDDVPANPRTAIVA